MTRIINFVIHVTKKPCFWGFSPKCECESLNREMLAVAYRHYSSVYWTHANNMDFLFLAHSWRG